MDRKQDVKCVKQNVLIPVPLYFVGGVGILYLGRSHMTENYNSSLDAVAFQ